MTTDKSETSEILKAMKELQSKVIELQSKVDEGREGDDLEKDFEPPDEKKQSVMLEIDPTITDSFGDSIQLTTKSRLKDYPESFNIARNFVVREYHNMIGDRYGRHSKLIPVYDEDGRENKIDMVWFSGNDVKIVEITDSKGNTRLYYKIRLLVRDILTKKLLLSRIPTSDGAARQEEIQHIGAGTGGKPWLEQNAPVSPMKPIKYTPNKGNRTTMKQVGEVVFE